MRATRKTTLVQRCRRHAGGEQHVVHGLRNKMRELGQSAVPRLLRSGLHVGGCVRLCHLSQEGKAVRDAACSVHGGRSL